jgi:predicted RND superfamily exporter protein
MAKDLTAKQTFGLNALLGVAMVVIIVGIAVAYGLSILSDIKSDFTANSIEANATSDTIAAVAKIPDKLGLIVTIVIAVIILTILVVYLWGRFQNVGGSGM